MIDPDVAYNMREKVRMEANESGRDINKYWWPIAGDGGVWSAAAKRGATNRPKPGPGTIYANPT